MDYTINRLITEADFDAVDAHTRAALSAHGFGVLTGIDIKAKKKKLDVDMPPCNVILREVTGGVEVSAIDPAASMQVIDNPLLHAVAGQMRDLLTKAVADI
ncbi:DUF302 domain-containing protein [Tabrizicola soli]|jgi:uncharacterized protein (DUF302 family)|uniref:DUF302 domain-containing protein n=1 Tax=Tabrizicola soli TaxID=2185115 RepID=A0ABV7DSL1_9RHOB|nr:DUF302 domain-containing protein [Tabrizicola soli]